MSCLKVLSLFDGISAGQVALNKLGINIDTYYASEIDKYAIDVTQRNFPNTVQLGDVNNWREWGLDLSKIDLLLAGFPCQNYSVSGNRTGVEGPSGKLVLVLFEIFEEIKKQNPNVKFLFENVKMSGKHLDFINNLFGVQPVLINSALFSAQRRERNYWTNLPVDTSKIEDKHIYLKDILESGEVNREKSYCIDASYYKGANLEQYLDKSRRQLVFESTKRLASYGNGGQGQRIYSIKGKSVTLSALGGGQGAKTGLYLVDLPDGDYVVRKLTPIECERLQCFPYDYTQGASDTQRYKMLGNSWTVDVICFILGDLCIKIA